MARPAGPSPQGPLLYPPTPFRRLSLSSCPTARALGSPRRGGWGPGPLVSLWPEPLCPPPAATLQRRWPVQRRRRGPQAGAGVRTMRPGPPLSKGGKGNLPITRAHPKGSRSLSTGPHTPRGPPSTPPARRTRFRGAVCHSVSN